MDDLHLAALFESTNYPLGGSPDYPPPRVIPPTAREIIQGVADKYHIKLADLLSDRRTRQLAFPRFEACYEVARLTRLSLPQIGARMGGRHHTTILNGIRRHCELNGLPLPRARA